MIVKIDSIYDLISLFSLYINLYAGYNFDIVMCIGIFLCVFFQDFVKEITHGWYPNIFKRPNGAINCNLFNKGGLVDHNSGFPSGHVTVVSFFMNLLFLRKYKNYNCLTTIFDNNNNNNTVTDINSNNTITNINTNSNVLTCNFTTILLYYGPIVLMGYARIMKGCHNLIQVIAGYILGFIIANIVHYFETVYISYIENIDPNKDRHRDR